MANSISKLPNSAESMNLTQWSNFSDQNKFGRLGDIQSLRDPLRRISFRTADILAVYGYHIVNTNAYLIYFWQEDMNSLRWRQGELKSSKAFYRKKANLSEYLELGIMLGNVYASPSENIQSVGVFP